VPWRGLLLAGAAGQLGARLVPLPGGLGGVEGGVLGALALTGTHPATALTAVIIYRVAGYWAPGAAGAITAAVLTRRHPARAARPPAPLRPQAPPPPAPGQPPSPRQAGRAELSDRRHAVPLSKSRYVISTCCGPRARSRRYSRLMFWRRSPIEAFGSGRSAPTSITLRPGMAAADADPADPCHWTEMAGGRAIPLREGLLRAG
jgi:hypothetical protein